LSVTLESLVAVEMATPAPDVVVGLAAQLAGRAPGRVAAVLYYGSALRDEALDGILDFYVLLDRAGAWPEPLAVSLAGRWLPPNVGYLEADVHGRALRAKYAVMTLKQFRRGMRIGSMDTTLWARFSQPCVCVWSRDAAARDTATDIVASAVVTASAYAAALGPKHGVPLDYWRALYTATYAAELRVERKSRGDDLVTRHAERFDAMLPLAWTRAGIDFAAPAAGEINLQLKPLRRGELLRRWSLRKRFGRWLNAMRLVKAAFTFDNATDYVAWKVERHSGYRIEPTDFQRRHPLLSAPAVFWRLRRNGVLK